MSREYTLQLRYDKYSRKGSSHIGVFLFRIGVYIVVELMQAVVNRIMFLPPW